MVPHLMMSGHRSSCKLTIKTADWRGYISNDQSIFMKVGVTPPLIQCMFFLYLGCILHSVYLVPCINETLDMDVSYTFRIPKIC